MTQIIYHTCIHCRQSKNPDREQSCPDCKLASLQKKGHVKAGARYRLVKTTWKGENHE